MNFTVIDVPPRSPEWFQVRAGRLTASVASDMLATLKGGKESAARRDLRTRLALERIIGRPIEDDYINADMRRGIELEPAARAAYEAYSGQLVEPCGFVAHHELMIGCSPDGAFDGLVGGLELKAPRPANHLRYLRERALPAEHKPQIAHSLWVTGASWWEFASFCDLFPESLQLMVVRVDRADVDLIAYEKAALAFLEEVSRECEAVATMAEVGF